MVIATADDPVAALARVTTAFGAVDQLAAAGELGDTVRRKVSTAEIDCLSATEIVRFGEAANLFGGGAWSQTVGA